MATQAEIEAAGVAKEVAANKRRSDAGLPLNAVEYEAAANIRSRAAGFKNAAAQEQDANRRARQVINPDTGQYFRNAAEKETWNNSRQQSVVPETEPSSEGGSQAGPVTGYKVTFAYIKGMWYSFPNVQSAREAVSKYTGNPDSVTYTKPRGVAIKTSLGWSTDGEFVDMVNWPDQVFAPEGVIGDALWNPPNNPITVETTVPADPDDPADPADPADASKIIIDYDNSWDNLDQDLLNLSKRYADAGMMGRARTAFNQAGGTWDTDTHKRMIQERDQEGPNYGGQFEFDWANRGITDAADLDKIKAWAKDGKFGRIKQFMESKKAGSYDKDVHVKLKAGTHRAEHDYVPPSETTTKDPAAYDPSAFKGAVEDIRGKFKTGQAREHAKTWRQTHMGAAEKKYGIKRDEAGKVVKPKSDAAWKAYIAQRNKVAGRHRQLIGAGKKTLKSGVVIG